MSCLRTPNFLRLILLACLLFNVRAFAQFEIDPDHFDSETNRSVRDTVAKNKTRTTAPTTAPKNSESATQVASPYAVQLNQRIEEQRANIAEYRAQINAKKQQMEAAWQSLVRTGNEAGEGEALAIYQRDLEQLQKSLASAIQASEVTLARLQDELAASQSQASRRVKRRAL